MPRDPQPQRDDAETKPPASDASRADDPGDDTVDAAGLILPGGKVDPDAIRAALEQADDDEGLRTVRFHLRRDLDKRLDKYLTDRITFMSRSQLQRLIDDGAVTVNGRRPKASTKVQAGDTVEVVVPPPPPKGTQPQDIPLDVMYEDQHLIVINKRPDIITHPARSHLSGTLINALAFHFQHRSPMGGQLSAVGQEFARPGVVHRLDRDTTGCVVFAKDDETHWKLGRLFETRRVEKRYLAVVHGRVEPAADAIELPIGPHPSREKGYREKHVVRHDELGKPSLTIYRVRERFGLTPPAPTSTATTTPTPDTPGWRAPHAAPTAPTRRPAPSRGTDTDYSLLELELKTGRTHQIRVHLSHLGWPIVGDDMYGGRPYLARDGTPVIERQALHAALLAFTHPMTGRELSFVAPARDDMARLIATLRASPYHESIDGRGATIDLDLVVHRTEK
ncbi:MAG: RluA family pseudouridine synthase [Phycisphaeraceae bacterium]|nr:MAG: RluA family pseudouridine synthase [Phycisphaeraceae bacterium]